MIHLLALPVFPILHGSLVLLLLHPNLEILYLVLDQFIQELAQFIEGHFPRLLFSENMEWGFVLILKACVLLPLNLGSFQESLDKSLDLIDRDDTNLVSIDGVEYIFSHFWELIAIDEDVGEVLDSFLVVYYHMLFRIIFGHFSKI